MLLFWPAVFIDSKNVSNIENIIKKNLVIIERVVFRALLSGGGRVLGQGL